MKNLSILLLLLSVGLSAGSCNRNRLKTNENELTKELVMQENKNLEAARIAMEKELADTLNKRPAGARYKEDRSVDPFNPPIEIDIAANLNNMKDYKLSDIFSELRYVRIEQPPDSVFNRDRKMDYYLTDDYIIAANTYGILQYDKNGKYLKTIVKNELTISGFMITSFIGASYMAGGGTAYNNIKSIGNKLYYSYVNNITFQEYQMEYDCSEIEINQPLSYNPEFPSNIIGKGEIIADYNTGGGDPQSSQIIRMTRPGEGNGYVKKSFKTKWIDNNTFTKKLNGDYMFAIINSQGDTLSKFVRNEKLINYTKSVQRGTDDGAQYEIKGRQYYRPQFNDTVFQVIPPNRLVPVYVLNLGGYKVTRQQGVDPGFDLKGKIIPEEWIETEKYILLTFTRDEYDCPNTRMKKTVKIYLGVYSKLSGEFSVISGDPFDYSPEILKNDYDGGLPVWPYMSDNYIIGQNGEVTISLKGRELKERVTSEHFKKSDAPQIRKAEFEKLAESVSDNEDILMIVK